MKLSKRGLFKGLFAATVVPTVANRLAEAQMWPQATAGYGFMPGMNACADTAASGGGLPVNLAAGSFNPDSPAAQPDDFYLLTDIGCAI